VNKCDNAMEATEPIAVEDNGDVLMQDAANANIARPFQSSISISPYKSAFVSR